MCGICSVTSSLPLELNFLVHQLMLCNHRGHEAAGLATIAADGTVNRFVGFGAVRDACHADRQEFRLFSERFNIQRPRTFVGHTRYSTVGPSDLNNAQPLLMEHPSFGLFLLVHNGQIPCHERLRRQLERNGHRFATLSDSEVLAAMIAHSTALTLPDAVAEAMNCIDGAYSIIAINRHHVVAARDPHGFWPLWYGQTSDHAVVIASEEPLLGNVQNAYEVDPGTMVVVDVLSHSLARRTVRTAIPHRCWLDVVYLTRPDEGLGTRTTGDARYALGQRLALDAPVEADLVVGVPDSGIDAAAGFAAQSGIVLEQRALVRNRFAPGRSFILPGQVTRQSTIREKHSVNSRKVANQRVAIVDDTVIRSNTAQTLTAMLREAGVTQVHWRIAAPAVRHPCLYGIDIPTREELAAHRRSGEEIAEHIGADSLQYLSHAAMLMVLNEFHSGWCTACVTGSYPVALG